MEIIKVDRTRIHLNYNLLKYLNHVKQFEAIVWILIVNRQTKIAADDIFIFYFYLLKKIRLDFPCETSSLIFSEQQRKNIYEFRLLQS